MKLITLNIWGGHLRNPLLKFIHNNRDIDIFCLQEVYYNAHRTLADKEREISFNIFSDLQRLLPNHYAIFKPAVENVYGIAILIKNNIDIISEGEINIHQKQHYPGIGHNHDRNLQWIECEINYKPYSILNVHGLWNGKGKKDTPERLNQSHRIRQFMDTLNTPKILCGDFNLRPDTESMHILEEGMINLVKTNNIRSTRTRFYTKEEKFADYILTSPEIKINQFRVMDDEVSDHSPLLLDFI
ncbi:endonuclease/exonuclease/phosphatase family protein [Legionella sp. km535]|uniref:endonuclease/exonuclease/phosphatase family protein n=1 Tax=Legionella sp. km535 TaxID=2498107 RepID=UPI000F8CFFCF|nr:endonuclease/exonuclease/phosphatase family protein [Legionella sp. km535]RUR19652.1 endonuclease/exonuclease/phosphatase family protein [Legionella sp. km535]